MKKKTTTKILVAALLLLRLLFSNFYDLLSDCVYLLSALMFWENSIVLLLSLSLSLSLFSLFICYHCVSISLTPFLHNIFFVFSLSIQLSRYHCLKKIKQNHFRVTVLSSCVPAQIKFNYNTLGSCQLLFFLVFKFPKCFHLSQLNGSSRIFLTWTHIHTLTHR